MESHAIYLAKIQSLRKSLNEKTLSSYPVFKNSQNLEDFLGKKNKNEKNFAQFNKNETIINFKEFDEKIKPNKIYRSNTTNSDEDKGTLLKLLPNKQFNDKQKLSPEYSNLNDNNSNELIKSKTKFDSFLTTVSVSKKSTGNNGYYTNNNAHNNDLASDSLLTVKLKQEKNLTNKINKNFNTSIDGKKIDDRNQNFSPLVIESLPTSATLTGKSETNIEQNRASQTNLNFTLPKMNTQYPIHNTNPSLLNNIINKSNQMSTLNSVKKIRKLLCLDDFSMSVESNKSKPKKSTSKGQKLKTALSLTKNDNNRINSGISTINQPDALSKMIINTKITRPNNLTPIESVKKKSFENSKMTRASIDENQLNTSNDYQYNYIDKKSYTEFSLKVFITDRARCPPTTPNEKLEHKNDNCLLCASLAKGNLFDTQDFLSPSANLQLQRQYEQYLLSMN